MSDQQAAWDVPEKRPDSKWPQDGVIKFDDYQTRYREGLDLVLRGIDCSVKSGEKVSIVAFVIAFCESRLGIPRRLGAMKLSFQSGLLTCIKGAWKAFNCLRLIYEVI